MVDELQKFYPEMPRWTQLKKYSVSVLIGFIVFEWIGFL